MKPQLFATAEMLREYDGDLPAAGTIRAGGFLALACPVARVGDRRIWTTAMLVPFETRALLWQAENERRRDAGGQADYGSLDDLLVGQRDRKRGWTNAENLWCRAAAVVEACVRIKNATHGVVLLHRCALAALALTEEPTS